MEKMLNDFPFRTVLSFDPLFDYLQKREDRPDQPISFNKRRIRSLLEQVQDLRGPIMDPGRLKGRSGQVNRLMGTIFSPLFWETEAVGVVSPLSVETFFVSPRFKQLFLDEKGGVQGRLNVGTTQFNRGRIIQAYLFILERFYGIRQRFDYPLVRIVTDPVTGLERHFKMTLDFRFVDIHAVKAPRTLSGKERAQVLENLTNPEKLRDILPPEDFELWGFIVIRAVDNTVPEVISALERELIDQDSIMSRNGFAALQQNLKTLFGRANLVATLAGIQDDRALLLNSGSELIHRCIFTDSHHVPLSAFSGTVFERVINDQEIIRLDDVARVKPIGGFQNEIVETGVRSCLIGPLTSQGKSIGTLHLGSPVPGDFGALDALLMEQILPIFSLAIKKSLDELEHQAQDVIRRHCTAIHPAVEWRFRQAAMRYLEALRKDSRAKLEPIVFNNVYPLYGTADIRGSSEARNRAIQKDLIHHLTLGRRVIRLALKADPLSIFEELSSRIDAYIDKVQVGLETGDDLAVITFMRDAVEPVFSQASGFGEEVSQAVDAYFAAVDRKTGTVYQVRRDFEESFSHLSQQLSTYLDGEETKAQQIFPHYFERHETDGVDYLIYLGDALVESGKYHDIYLHNLRLWQLRLACGMARRAERLKATLKVPLEIGQLILVQNAPLSIRFRYDEKHFSVDGAYDIRHAIIRSRLDKAVVRETGERLTQPGKIAVVYSSADEADEMTRHIEFLQKKGYLAEEIERLDLGDMPGVSGLKSLRVPVLSKPAGA